MLRKWLRQRLGLRLAAVCFTLSIFIAVLVTSFQVYHLKQAGHEQAEQLFTQIEQSFIPALSDAMWTLDPIRTKAQLDALSHLPTVGTITLVDDSGHESVREVHPIQHILGKRTYNLAISIDNQEFKLGTLKVVLDSTALDLQLSELWKVSLLTAFTVTMISSFLLVWLFHHWVVLQLQQVSTYASQLNAQNLSTPLVLTRPTAPDDEIGAIVVALTEMQQQLLKEFERRATAEGELRAYQSHLETMVDNRTQQLAEQTKALESQSKILVEQNSELNAFAHTVAHDLKHPITSLIGLSTLLSKAFDSLEKDQQQEFLQQILQSSIKMNSMINGLLQLASLRSDEQPETSTVDMNATVQDALKNLSTLVQEYNPIVMVYPNMPTLQSHGQWIEEIWLNYISNAIKYGGEPAFVTIGFDKSKTDNTYTFWVEDRGAGVSSEKADRLFTEFSRLHTLRKDSHGLGLSIVKRICNKLGGQCGYEPNKDGGSRFWFSLPLTNSIDSVIDSDYVASIT